MSNDESIPDEEREALVTIAHGAVVTSSGVSGQRLLLTALEVVLARGLGPVAYGVYALAWRIAQLLAYLVPFGTVATLQRYLPEYADSPNRRSQVVGLSYTTTALFGVGIAVGVWYATPHINELTLQQPAFLSTMRAFGFLVGMLGISPLPQRAFARSGPHAGKSSSTNFSGRGSASSGRSRHSGLVTAWSASSVQSWSARDSLLRASSHSPHG